MIIDDVERFHFHLGIYDENENDIGINKENLTIGLR
jgi:hypothetical protein